MVFFLIFTFSKNWGNYHIEFIFVLLGREFILGGRIYPSVEVLELFESTRERFVVIFLSSVNTHDKNVKLLGCHIFKFLIIDKYLY